MSSSGIRKFKTMQDRTVDLMVNQESNFIGALKVTGTEQTIGAIIGLGEATSGGPGAPVGNFLETGGGTMSGPIAYHPQEVTVDADNNINIGFEQGSYSTYIRMTATGATDDLENIIGAQFSGQDLILQGTDTKTITLKTTGNIVPPGGADYVLVDEDIIRAVFDDIQNKWVFWAGAGNIGANIFLSNLDPTTAINSSLVPNAPGTLDLGSDTNFWDQVKAQEIKFLGSVSAPAGTSTEISVDASGDLQFGLIDDIDAYKFYWNGTLGASFVKSGTTIQINADNFSATNQFIINDSTTDPAIDGIFTQNAGDVKVYSGGAVRNFSDIIAGGGANKELSNLNSTSINQSLVPDGTTRDLGSDTNYWDQVKTVEIKFLGSHAAPAGTTTEISIDASGDLQFGLVDALTDFYKFYWNGVLGITMQESSTGIWQINASNINLLNQIILNDSTTDPAINGIFTQNAGDVKVFSGGSVRNFSDLISNPANDSLSNLTTTSINQGLVPDGAGTRDLGSDTNFWDQVKVQEVKFLGSVSAPAGTTTEISVDASGDLQFGLVDDIDAYKFYWNGSLGASFVKSGSTIQINADNFSATNQLIINDSTTDPAIDGIFTQNAGDVKVFSGGAVRNFSDITVYANRQLSNLSGTVALNLTIQPDSPAGRDLGTDTNYFDQVKVQEVKFLGSVSAPAGTTTEISVDASGDMQFGLVDTTDSYHFYFDGSNRMLVSNSQLNLTGNLVLDNALGMTYTNAAFDPAANGEFRLNATDMKVFSGGAVRNLSDIGSGGADTALSNLITTTINQSLVPNTIGTRDLGSDTNYWDQVKVQEVKFLGSVSAPAGTTTEISVDASGDMQFGLIDTTDSYHYYFDGSLRMLISNSQLNLTGNMVLDNAIGMTFDDAAFAPVANGEFRLDGSDMKVFSGGAVRNMSDIGTGGGDMVLADVQIVTGLKTFETQTLGVRNILDTQTGTFVTSITGATIWTLPPTTQFIVGSTQSITLLNKTISASSNTLTNIGLAELENQLDGGLFTWNTSGAPILLAPGASDEVLTAHGAGAALTWEAAGGGGANTALSNLTTTDINENLIPDQVSGGVLGGPATLDHWFNIYVNNVRLYDKILFEDTASQTSTNREILSTSANVIEYNVPSTGAHRFDIGAGEKLLIQSDLMECKSDLFAVVRTSAIVDLFLDRRGSAGDGAVIGNLTWSAEDSASAFHEWARINGGIIDETSTDREGFMRFFVSEGATDELVEYLEFDGDDQLVKFKRRAQMLHTVAPGRLQIGLDPSVSTFNGQNVGEIEFIADDDADQQNIWTEIRNFIEDDTNGTEDGSMQLRCDVNGGSTTFIRMNNSSLAHVTIDTDLFFSTTKSKVVPESAEFLGHFVKNETGTVGDLGTMQVPEYTATSAPSNSTLNTNFGSFTGASGMFRDTDTASGSRFYTKGSDGNWYYSFLTQQT